MTLTFLPIALLTFISPSSAFLSSPKRGLIYLPTMAEPSDDSIWTSKQSPLTWYYNYGPRPSPQLTSSDLHFVPMMWGLPEDDDEPAFHEVVKGLIAQKTNVTHVLGFNEPDEPKKTGGSSMSPEDAAKAWREQMGPVRDMDAPGGSRAQKIQVGGPAVTGSERGLKWLGDFMDACKKVAENDEDGEKGKGQCEFDFLPVHWYGPFEGLEWFMKGVSEDKRFEGMRVWVTEFGMIGAGLEEVQGFFRRSTELFDGLDYVDRYAYFGSFRSDESNVGHNAAMLTEDGKLTDIGSWYLGGEDTGNVPGAAMSLRPSLSLVAGLALVSCGLLSVLQET